LEGSGTEDALVKPVVGAVYITDAMAGYTVKVVTKLPLFLTLLGNCGTSSRVESRVF
jgi:hypothetical protein